MGLSELRTNLTIIIWWILRLFKFYFKIEYIPQYLSWQYLQSKLEILVHKNASTDRIHRHESVAHGIWNFYSYESFKRYLYKVAESFNWSLTILAITTQNRAYCLYYSTLPLHFAFYTHKYYEFLLRTLNTYYNNKWMKRDLLYYIAFSGFNHTHITMCKQIV